MSPETNKHIKEFCKEIINTCDFLKSTDFDQFTIMRIALIRSIADQIYHHLEV